MKHLRRMILAIALSAGIVPAFGQVPPPVPALPDTERRTSYSLSASTCACAVNFALYGDSTDYANWLEVFVNGALISQSGNWTITSPTGPLSTIPRPITDAVLTFTVAQTGAVQIVGARRPRRVSQFNENAGVSARNLNQTFTDIISQNREIWDKTNDVTGRAVLARPGETLALLPILASRQNLGACFDNNGNLTSCVSVPSGTFSAGNGIAFTGTGPTAITANLSAGSGITITGTNPLTISAPTPTYTLAATGGVSRTLASKLGDQLSVADFGAVDDNSTDNTPKIQAAINVAQLRGRALHFPLNNTGVYLLNTAFNSFSVLNITAPITLVCEPGVWLKPSSSITNAQSILYFAGTTAIETVQVRTIVDGCNIGDPTSSTRFGNNGIFFDTTASNTAQFIQPIVQNLKITYANINAHSCFSSFNGCAIFVDNSPSNTSGGTFGALFQNSMLAGGVNFFNAGDSNAVRNVFFPPDLTDVNVSNQGIYANLIAGAGQLLIDNVNCQVNNGCVVIDNAASVEIKNPNFEQIAANSENNNAMIDIGSSVANTTLGVGPVHIIGGSIVSNDCVNHPFLITFNKVGGSFFDGLRLGENCPSYPHAMVQLTANSSQIGIGAGNTWFVNGSITTTVAVQYVNAGTGNYKIAVTTP